MTIANGLIKIAHDKRLNLHFAYIHNIFAGVAVYKFYENKKTIFMFSDYSAVVVDSKTESIIEYDSIRRDMIEISFRCQQIDNVNCPAYLRKEMLKWLRENGD